MAIIKKSPLKLWQHSDFVFICKFLLYHSCNYLRLKGKTYAFVSRKCVPFPFSHNGRNKYWLVIWQTVMYWKMYFDWRFGERKGHTWPRRKPHHPNVVDVLVRALLNRRRRRTRDNPTQAPSVLVRQQIAEILNTKILVSSVENWHSPDKTK